MGFDIAKCMVKDSKTEPVTLSNATLEEIVMEIKTRFKGCCIFKKDAYNEEMYFREHGSVLIVYLDMVKR